MKYSLYLVRNIESLNSTMFRQHLTCCAQWLQLELLEENLIAVQFSIRLSAQQWRKQHQKSKKGYSCA